MSPEPNLHCNEELFLLESPCSSTPPSILTFSNSHEQQQQRCYHLFDQSKNELSMERKRLDRMRLQATAQQQEEFRQMTATAGLRTMEYQHHQQQDHRPIGIITTTAELGGGPLETPKKGGKVLVKIDGNIPTTGPRLVPPFQQHNSNTRIVRVHRQSLAEAHHPYQQQHHSRQSLLQPIGTRKRRADESEERLNLKERIWVCADVDRAIHLDGRCLQALLEAEKEVQVSNNQIRRQQQQPNGNGVEVGVDEAARDQLIQWLLEICQMEQADFVVLPLTVAFLDRVLATKFVPRRNVQALGSACLLLASKMKAPQPILAGKLMELTDGMIKADELLDWEMVVVNQLQWNLLQSTPFEFFDQLLVRAPVLEALREDFAICLHQMQKELSLATQLPSVQASACLLFCALRSRRQHLLTEAERTIRRYFLLDPISCLVPLLGTIATTINGIMGGRLIAADVEQMTGWIEMPSTMRPPSSKRMSFERPPSANASFLSAIGQNLLMANSLNEARILSNSISTNASSVTAGKQPGLPSCGEEHNGSSPPSNHQAQHDDESSRSSTNSSNESTKATKMANDSGYRSSEAEIISPLLLDRKAKDFGPLC